MDIERLKRVLDEAHETMKFYTKEGLLELHEYEPFHELAAARADVEAAGWVSVKDKMPDRDPDPHNDLEFCERSVVVLCTDGKREYIGFHQVDHEVPRCTAWVEQGRDAYALRNITHWMPLPELPRA